MLCQPHPAFLDYVDDVLRGLGEGGARLATIPALVSQGATDGLVVASVQRDLVDRLCAAGSQIDFRVYVGHDRISLIEPDLPLSPSSSDEPTTASTGCP